VVVWESRPQDGFIYGVFGKRFDNSGNTVGGEFQVNSFTAGVERYPAISHDSAGGFVVVWHGNSQDGSSYGVLGKRFDSSGSTVGAEFQVNSFTPSNQRSPALSHDSAGGFVVVWESYAQDGPVYGVFGKRFDSSGSTVGAEFQVNSFTINVQKNSAISHDSAGGFVVVWESYAQDGSNYGVFGKRFDSSGIAVGGEFQVNSFTTSVQKNPAISHDSAGGFVVVWDSAQDGSGFGVFGQRFDSGGMVLGGEFQINSFTTSNQRSPAISHDSAGGFVVVWHSYAQDGFYYGVFGQRFDTGGIPLGGEFQVNSFTSFYQRIPAVSHDSAGGFVVVWQSEVQDASSYGVFGQRFFVGRVVTGPSLTGASKARRFEGPLSMAPP
jgi:hypothetical protein